MEQFGKINNTEIEEMPHKSHKRIIAAVLSCIAVLAVLAAAGIFIVRAYYSDERKLIKGFQNLAGEINERQRLWEEAAGNIMAENTSAGNTSAGNTSAHGLENMKMIASLNLSGDDLPITIGVDTTLLKDSGAHKIRTSTALSVMNYELIGLVIYGDDEKFALSIPDLWRQNLEFAPERIDRQYNDSLFARKFGSIESGEISIELFPEKEDTSRLELFKFLLEKMTDIFGRENKDSGTSASKIRIEKLEKSIKISVPEKDGRQYKCSQYRIIFPKEWIEGIKTDNMYMADKAAMDGTADIMQDVVLLIDMEQNSRIIRISLEEPVQFWVKSGEYEGIAEFTGSVSFLGEERGIDNIVVSMDAEAPLEALNLQRKEFSAFGNNISGEEKKVKLQLGADIFFNQDDICVTIDINKMICSVDSIGTFRVTGKIDIEPLREEILPLDGETLQIFQITEDEYEDLKSQLQKKMLKWLKLFAASSGTKLERTSLKYKTTFSGLRRQSTCLCFVYIAQLGFGNREFRNCLCCFSGNCETLFFRRPLYNIYKTTQARFRCIAASSGT